MIEEKIMDIEERKHRLSQMARNKDFYKQFHAGDALQAIDLLNKMDSVYKQQVDVTHEVRHTFVFMLPDGTRFTPGLLPQTTSIIDAEVKEIT